MTEWLCPCLTRTHYLIKYLANTKTSVDSGTCWTLLSSWYQILYQYWTKYWWSLLILTSWRWCSPDRRVHTACSCPWRRGWARRCWSRSDGSRGPGSTVHHAPARCSPPADTPATHIDETRAWSGRWGGEWRGYIRHCWGRTCRAEVSRSVGKHCWVLRVPGKQYRKLGSEFRPNIVSILWTPVSALYTTVLWCWKKDSINCREPRGVQALQQSVKSTHFHL